MGKPYKKKAKTVIGESSNNKRKNESSLEQSNESNHDSTIERGLQIERLEAEIFEVRELLENTMKNVDVLTACNDNLTFELNQEKRKSKILSNNYNELEQYSRKNNVRIFGVKDTNKNESAEETENLVRDLLRNRLGLNFSPGEFEICHRLGRFVVGSNRCIIVKFVRRKAKNATLYNRKKLAGSSVSISEDLTLTNVKRLQELRGLKCVFQCWSKDGKLFAKSANGFVREVRWQEPITENLFDEPTLRSQASTQQPQQSSSNLKPSTTKPSNQQSSSPKKNPQAEKDKQSEILNNVGQNNNNNNNIDNKTSNASQKSSSVTGAQTNKSPNKNKNSGDAPAPNDNHIQEPVHMETSSSLHNDSTITNNPLGSSTPTQDSVQQRLIKIAENK